MSSEVSEDCWSVIAPHMQGFTGFGPCAQWEEEWLTEETSNLICKPPRNSRVKTELWAVAREKNISYHIGSFLYHSVYINTTAISKQIILSWQYKAKYLGKPVWIFILLQYNQTVLSAAMLWTEFHGKGLTCLLLETNLFWCNLGKQNRKVHFLYDLLNQRARRDFTSYCSPQSS